MAITKFKKIILILYLAVFPLGQIPALILSLINPALHSVHLSDLLIFTYVLTALITNKRIARQLIYTDILKVAATFILSSIAGLVLFHYISFISVLYLARVICYLLFAYVLWVERPVSKHEFLLFVKVSGLAIALTGLFQYFFIPDTRSLQAIGWDDHYFRLISTFLDPAFTGVILVVSFVFLLLKDPASKRNKMTTLAIILTALFLTYSRASYLALFAGLFTYVFCKQKSKKILLSFSTLFVLVLFLLPRPSSEGVKLERTFSILLRARNVTETISIWRKSPIFGVGYNNICQVKNEQTASTSNLSVAISHSCAGADNSVLFLVATTGVIGALYILALTLRFIKKHKTVLFLSLLASVFLHSQFSNTIFYSWIFAWFALFGSVYLVKGSK